MTPTAVTMADMRGDCTIDIAASKTHALGVNVPQAKDIKILDKRWYIDLTDEQREYCHLLLGLAESASGTNLSQDELGLQGARGEDSDQYV